MFNIIVGFCSSSNGTRNSVRFPRAIIAVIAAGQWIDRRRSACSACQRCRCLCSYMIFIIVRISVCEDTTIVLWPFSARIIHMIR